MRIRVQGLRFGDFGPVRPAGGGGRGRLSLTPARLPLANYRMPLSHTP